MAAPFELKPYQREALDALRAYLADVEAHGARVAFLKATNNPYHPAPHLDAGMPYVCIRIPTGGGKTIMAAHAVGIAASEHMHADNPMVLWLVPSTTIRDQTLDALRAERHPYRAALAERFGQRLSVMDVREALSLSRLDALGNACVIVGTIQAFRIEETEGRKVYDDNGALMGHFDLPPGAGEGLETIEGTDTPVRSLANVLRLHRPMVIVDEAHNARTPLSFQTLARFRPSMVLEMTATPELINDPAKDKHPSNVLFQVSAAELKAAEMIKLPVRLQTDPDWKRTIGAALDCQAALEAAALAEEKETGEYVRPIVLFHAQSASKTDPDRLVPSKIEEFLRDDKRIPADRIAIQGSGRNDLDGLDILSRDCPVRYVITIAALREGWDCPFAYALCSVAELSSPTAVEQLLGRVLRLPHANLKGRDLLNRAYAFVASGSFQSVAERLRDGLVEGAGFDRIEAARMVADHGDLGFEEDQADYAYESEPLPAEVDDAFVAQATARLPPSLRERIAFSPATRTLSVVRPMTLEDRNTVQLAFAGAPVGVDRIVSRLHLASNRLARTEAPEVERPTFIVPGLDIMRQGELELFGREHFLDLPWRLDECAVDGVVEAFAVRDATRTGELDVDDTGRVRIAFSGELHDQLALTIREPAWSVARLANWIDRGIPHPDVTKPAARDFIHRAITALIEAGPHTLDELARHKYALRRTVADEIVRLRRTHAGNAQDALFAANTSEFRTASEIGFLFSEAHYAYNRPYRGGTTFAKHLFPIVGDLEPSGEEFECACHLDRHDAVRTWVRNVDRKPNAFWLQTPVHRFYPDFVALLNDGRYAAIEYKGADRYDDEDSRRKRRVGELWAEASEGTCAFVMPTRGRFAEIDRVFCA